MVKNTVQVALRIRPTDAAAADHLSTPTSKTLVAKDPKQKSQEYQFTFDDILQNASQEDVFQACADDIIKTALDGCNGTILAYGQTGAGKTYSMTGGKANYKQRGLIPRTIHKVFAGVKAHQESNWTVRVSYLEIYNEQCYDLLDISTQPSDIAIVEDNKDRVIVKGLATPVAATEAEALQYLFEGEGNRMVAEHQLNRASSRSHTIFSIMLERSTDAAGDEMIVSKLNLVDLAGSERICKTKSEGLVLKEAQQINKSLSFLEQVIVALSVRGRDHIPYRSSKLTHVLKDSLGGNCKTLMLACIWGEASQLEETTSTCRFAQRMRCVANDFVVNIRKEPTAIIRKYEQDIKELQQELAMHDSLTERHGIVYEPYGDEQKAQVQADVRAWLQSDDAPDSIAPLQLVSLRHIKEVLFAVKAMYQEARSLQRLDAKPSISQPAPSLIQSASQQGPDAETQYVGDLEHGGEEHTFPMAPADARPSALMGAPAQAAPSSFPMAPPDARPPSSARAGTDVTPQPDSETGVASSSATLPALQTQQPPPNQQVAFEEYKQCIQGEGAQKAQLSADNRQRLRQAKQHARDLALTINATKRQIDALRLSEIAATDQESGEAGPSSPSQQSRELKSLYREQYTELQAVRAEADYTQKLAEQCMQELVLDFQAWYVAKYAVAPPAEAQVLQTAADVQVDEDVMQTPETDVTAPKSHSQVPSSPPDPLDDEATAFYNAQQGLRGKTLTVKRTMAATRRRPAMLRS